MEHTPVLKILQIFTRKVRRYETVCHNRNVQSEETRTLEESSFLLRFTYSFTDSSHDFGRRFSPAKVDSTVYELNASETPIPGCSCLQYYMYNAKSVNEKTQHPP
jgi:hypothetical protein